MKRCIAVIFLAALLLTALLFPASASEEGTVPGTVFFSLYDDGGRVSLVENTKLEVWGKATTQTLLETAKQQDYITEYSVQDESLVRIVLGEEALSQASGADHVFYVKVNGAVYLDDALRQPVQDGDIVEWFFGLPPDMKETATVDYNVSGVLKNTGADWSAEAQTALTEACNYLSLHQEQSGYYVVALNSAGQTADAAVLDRVRNETSSSGSETAASLIKRILTMTASGYDASELVLKLSAHQGVESQGQTGYINGLVAYDCGDYYVSESQPNARQTMIDAILTEQRVSGGFGLQAETAEDADITAMAVTALSPYLDQPLVQSAVDRAVEFLSASQTLTGGFVSMGEESCESLAQVTIALSSIQADPLDPRFIKEDRTLPQQLLLYQNDDGGFAHTQGGESNVISTEQAVLALSAVKKNGNPYAVETLLVKEGGASSQPSAFPKSSSPEFPYYILWIPAGVLLLGSVLGLLLWKRRPKTKVNIQ